MRAFESYLLSKVLAPIGSELATSFNYLTPDAVAYNNEGKVSRKRHFSGAAVVDGHLVSLAEVDPRFNPKQDYHTEYGDVVAQISDALFAGGALESVLLPVLSCLPINTHQFAIGINQIRVVADDNNMGSPAPGLHKDGYDYSCHIAIARDNASGGASILSTESVAESVIVERVLSPGEFLFFDDRSLYHTATPVTCRIGGATASRDMIILDFIRL